MTAACGSALTTSRSLNTGPIVRPPSLPPARDAVSTLSAVGAVEVSPLLLLMLPVACCIVHGAGLHLHREFVRHHATAARTVRKYCIGLRCSSAAERCCPIDGTLNGRIDCAAAELQWAPALVTTANADGPAPTHCTVPSLRGDRAYQFRVRAANTHGAHRSMYVS